MGPIRKRGSPRGKRPRQSSDPTLKHALHCAATEADYEYGGADNVSHYASCGYRPSEVAKQWRARQKNQRY